MEYPYSDDVYDMAETLQGFATTAEIWKRLEHPEIVTQIANLTTKILETPLPTEVDEVVEEEKPKAKKTKKVKA